MAIEPKSSAGLFGLLGSCFLVLGLLPLPLVTHRAVSGQGQMLSVFWGWGLGGGKVSCSHRSNAGALCIQQGTGVHCNAARALGQGRGHFDFAELYSYSFTFETKPIHEEQQASPQHLFFFFFPSFLFFTSPSRREDCAFVSFPPPPKREAFERNIKSHSGRVHWGMGQVFLSHIRAACPTFPSSRRILLPWFLCFNFFLFFCHDSWNN